MEADEIDVDGSTKAAVVVEGDLWTQSAHDVL